MLFRHRVGLLDSRDEQTYFCQPVDYRSHLRLRVPCFGNAIHAAQPILRLPDLAPAGDTMAVESPAAGLQAAACAILAEVNAVTRDNVRDSLGLLKRTELETPYRLWIYDNLQTSGILLTSYFGFQMHTMDFGTAFGNLMEAFRLPSKALGPGVPVVLPRLLDGGCEFVIVEREDTIKSMVADTLYKKFVTNFEKYGA
ncbi:MAG: hypothetical protein Q9209_005746 [Squamulea sp. 1 TL-2023]